MTDNKKRTVYILGAGCSANYGYPVAKNFVAQLEMFGKSLPADLNHIKKCVDETVTTMKGEAVQTLDDLALRLHNGCFAKPSGVSRVDSNRREERIDTAKVAVSAFFLAKEADAKCTGLTGYHKLLLEIFGATRTWEYDLRKSKSCVLTFNYDRLFEMAFLDRIGGELARKGIYGGVLLNAGFHPFGDDLEFTDEGFCFLKLHGTIGGYVDLKYTDPQYLPYIGSNLPGSGNGIADLSSITAVSAGQLKTPLLIVFPHEKQHVQGGGRHLVYQKYISAIWNKAAIELARADEVWIIGYSFAELDRNSVIKLLEGAKNCKRVVIQNLPEEAERLCRMLKVKHPELSYRWESYAEQF